MSGLESNKVERCLLNKMKAERRDSFDWRYIIYNDQGKQISATRLSKGAKHTLGPKRVREMAHQIGLHTAQQFVNLVQCTLSREAALAIIETNIPSASPDEH